MIGRKYFLIDDKPVILPKAMVDKLSKFGNDCAVSLVWLIQFLIDSRIKKGFDWQDVEDVVSELKSINPEGVTPEFEAALNKLAKYVTEKSDEDTEWDSGEILEYLTNIVKSVGVDKDEYESLCILVWTITDEHPEAAEKNAANLADVGSDGIPEEILSAI